LYQLLVHFTPDKELGKVLRRFLCTADAPCGCCATRIKCMSHAQLPCTYHIE